MPNDRIDNEGAVIVEKSLQYGARSVTSILKPVIMCLILSVWFVRALQSPSTGQTYSPVMPYREKEGDDDSSKLSGALLNAIIFVGVILGMTIVLLVLYRAKCTKLIFGWLAATMILLLGGSGGYIFARLFLLYNIEMDIITFYIFLWNFTAVGVLAIFWHAPTIVRQSYLVFISAEMAWVFAQFPNWTAWALLIALALYDLFAVLAPCGPLKSLVETVQERGDMIPALVYDAEKRPVSLPVTQRDPSWARRNQSGAASDNGSAGPRALEAEASLMDDVDDRIGPHAESSPLPASPQPMPPPNRAPRGPNEPAQSGHYEHPTTPEITNSHLAAPSQTREQGDEEYGDEEDDDDEHGVKLGLGDFVFYSVLTAKAALFDYTTVFACAIAVLTGLCVTLFLLSMLEKALPALPLSIAFGAIFYYAVSRFGAPMAAAFATQHIFL